MQVCYCMTLKKSEQYNIGYTCAVCVCGSLKHIEESAFSSYVSKKSGYDQEIQQPQTADNPMAPRGRATQPSRDTRKTNQAKQPVLSSPSR